MRDLIVGALVGMAISHAAAALWSASEAIAHRTFPAKVAGRVVHVTDGDTLLLLDDAGSKHVVRLTDIDAPETAHGPRRPGQPFSNKATIHLRHLALNSPAEARCFDEDRRPPAGARVRLICKVTVSGKDLGLQMVDAGLAMANRQHNRYVRDPTTYLHEQRARAARVGLWAQANPVAPWEWRRECWGSGHCAGSAE
jgi:micrococcal nuclease